MNLTVHQSIMIHTIRIDSLANSSILQIGCAGTMKSVSQLFNTGGFLSVAPEPGEPVYGPYHYVPLVPLPSIR